MNLLKTTQYALKVLTYMAIEPGKTYSADQLNADTNIPKRYLRRLMTDLSKAGFIAGSRGRTGGFMFARDISSITLFDIISYMEEGAMHGKCILGNSLCAMGAPCVMHDDWVDVENRTLEVLKQTTLGSLSEKYQKRKLTGKR